MKSARLPRVAMSGTGSRMDRGAIGEGTKSAGSWGSSGTRATAMLGVLTGQLLQSGLTGKRKVDVARRCGASFRWGSACSGAAGLPSGGRRLRVFGTPWTDWPVWCPIIKNRWTSSYVLYAGGWSLLLAGGVLSRDLMCCSGAGGQAFRRHRARTRSLPTCAGSWATAYFARRRKCFWADLQQYLPAAWYEPLAWAAATAALWLLLWYLYRNRTFIRRMR